VRLSGKTLSEIDAVLAQIGAAFALVLRPGNDDLLHPNCFNDNDIATLYDVPHWRDLTDAIVENEYAAPAFLSPAGFRFFIPAYLSLSLRKPASGLAAVEMTLMSLSPEYDQMFHPSKFSQFNSQQDAAVIAFLEAMSMYEDVDDALLHWLERQAQLGEM
jgi:hypothetical protein